MLLLNINEKSLYRYYHNTINYAKQQIDLYSVLVVIKLSEDLCLPGKCKKQLIASCSLVFLLFIFVIYFFASRKLP